MEVDVLRSTDKPERLVCQAARGDYYEGYIGDTEYEELMATVDTKEDDRQTVLEVYGGADFDGDQGVPKPEEMAIDMLTRARTKAFCEKQLARGHYGPWEHPQITFSVKGVSRVTMAQITRHRHMTFDVQSQRYVDFSETEAIVPKALRDPDHFSRETGLVDVSDDDREEMERLYKLRCEDAMEMYQEMVDAGVPKEDARFILPLGTPVNMTFSGNARTFMHVFNLRQKPNSQWEIRELSDKLAEELKEWAPYTFNWYDENKPHKIGP